jgi:hypothetical protein
MTFNLPGATAKKVKESKRGTESRTNWTANVFTGAGSVKRERKAQYSAIEDLHRWCERKASKTTGDVPVRQTR